VPDHPDHEQLAAFQAGDGERRQLADVEAHLAGCPSCAAVVASVERARSRLALLGEPDLPPGLHDRLAAALEAEPAQAPADRPESRFGRAGSGSAGRPTAGRRLPGPRPVPWYRRRVAWGAAAALLLAALVAVPLLDQSSDLHTASQAGGGQAAEDLASPETAGPVPLIRVPGEVSAATVRARLASDTRAKAALDSATGAPAAAAPTGSGGTAGATQSPDQSAGGFRSSGPTSRAGSAGAALQACLPAAAAAAGPATRPLTPAFYLEGRYQGRAATVLVTASVGQPGRVDLWVFPRDRCAGPPLATERVR
jgi:hypothetical protein